MNIPGSGAVTTIRDRWDQFFTWLFKGWGYDATSRPNSPHAIKARVDAKLDALKHRADQVIKLAPLARPQVEVTQGADAEDTRPQPVPQDLDAITAAPPPPVTADQLPQIDAKLKIDLDPDWCTCEGIAHEAKCGFAATGLSIASLLPPPPESSAAAPTEPVPSHP